MTAEQYAKEMGISIEIATWWLCVLKRIGMKPNTKSLYDGFYHPKPRREVPKPPKNINRVNWMAIQLGGDKVKMNQDERLSAMQEVQRMVGTYKGVKHTCIPMGGKRKR